MVVRDVIKGALAKQRGHALAQTDEEIAAAILAALADEHLRIICLPPGKSYMICDDPVRERARRWT